MYRVLIVEDELLVRLGLKNSIRWEKYNMEVVRDLPDGEQAFEFYEKNRPDLIITDLKMNVMDGMTLIKKIREKDSETQIIILSCLEEFDLVRKAMSMGVQDYILKLTMTEEEIDKVLTKAQGALQNRATSSGAASSKQSDTEYAKEKYYKDFLFYGTISEESFQSFLRSYGLRIGPEKNTLCLLEIDRYETFKSTFEDKKGLMIRISMLNVLEEILGGFKRGEVFHDEDGRYVVIFSYKDMPSEYAVQQDLCKMIENIKSVLSSCFNITCSVGLSSTGSGYGKLRIMYTEALSALGNKFFIGFGMTHFWGKDTLRSEVFAKMNKLKNMPQLSLILSAEEKVEFNRKVDSLLSSESWDEPQFRDYLFKLIQWVLFVTHYSDDFFTSIDTSVSEGFQNSETLDEIITAFSHCLSNIEKSRCGKRGMSREIEAAVRLMEKNYNKDVTLKQISSLVGLTPNYLSNLFKKELGVNFSDYLKSLRIELAKKLLMKTSLKSYEIAEKTGFIDNTYFCKVFKKTTGKSPNEFRKHPEGD